MLPLAAYFGDILQVALALTATALMAVAVNAYRKRSEGRYLALAAAFVCLCSVSVITMFSEFAVGLGPATIQLFELYLIPSLELLMALSFLTALLWSPGAKRRLRVLFPLAVVLIGVAAFAAYALNSGASTDQPSLPADCARPPGGFLVVASALGYNDSISHGAPAQSWPVIDVSEGSNVTITVCNTYQLPVGFQVVHYLQNTVETIAPGQAMTVNFVADQTGTFTIYCSIFCPIHVYLQGGALRVT